MNRTFEDVRGMLAEQIKKEKLRLKSYGTKANSFDLAHVLAQYVRGMMTESRYRELVRLNKWLKKNVPKPKKQAKQIRAQIRERKKATQGMAQALLNDAKYREANRPWKSRR